MSVSARRTRKSVALVLLVCTSAVPMLLLACKQPAPAIVDAGPPPAATDAAPAVLVPLDEDAGNGLDASDAAPARHATGPGMNTNQLRAKQCCNALRAQAGTDPMLKSLAGQCDGMAAQLGSAGNAPEFAGVRSLLKGKNMPAICQGL
jgi:hypothetical protein